MSATTTVEQQRAARRRMMLEDPIGKVIPIIALPMVVSMVIDGFYNLADTYFVSQIGTAATAAVGVNNSLMHFIRALAMGFGMGASSYISRLLGAKKGDDASRVGTTALLTAVAFVTVMSAFAFIFRKPMVVLLGATESATPFAIDYATYILLSAPFTAASTVLSQMLRSEGSTTYSMLGLVSGCVVNLALDPLFIFVFHWGVAGAAAATGLSKMVSFAVLLSPFLRGKSLLHIKVGLFTPKWSIYKEIARMGVPTFLRSSLMSVATVVTNNMAGSFGDSVLAAVSVSNRVMMFVGSMVMGFGQGFQPIAGYCWGAGRYRRVRTAFWTTSGIGLAMCAVLGTLLFVFAPNVVGIFTTTDSEIVRIGAYMVRVQCLVLPFHLWVMIINGLFQALGRAVSAAVLGLSRQVICLIPCVTLLTYFFGMQGLMNAQACSDLLSMVIALPLLLRIMKEIAGRIKTEAAPEEEAAQDAAAQAADLAGTEE